MRRRPREFADAQKVQQQRDERLAAYVAKRVRLALPHESVSLELNLLETA